MVSTRLMRHLQRSYVVDCNRCGSSTKYKDLVKSSKGKYGVLPTCRPCYNTYNRSYIRRDWFAYKANAIRREANRKGVACEMDKKFLATLWELQDGKCALTGAPMDQFIGESYTKASLDQIEPGAGYTQNNVQLVTDWANRAKLQLSVEEFGDFVLQAAQHVKQKRNGP